MSGYPTREQAERIASETCGIQVCGHCDIAHWCVHDPNDNSSATRVCGESMLAMHDALDAKHAEIDRLREYLRDVQGELLIRFDNHEMPDLNMIEIAQRIDAFLSPSPLCDGDD